VEVKRRKGKNEGTERPKQPIGAVQNRVKGKGRQNWRRKLAGMASTLATGIWSPNRC
jgi:hypothetical protein